MLCGAGEVCCVGQVVWGVGQVRCVVWGRQGARCGGGGVCPVGRVAHGVGQEKSGVYGGRHKS